MKILLINKFLYRRGGAETSFLDTARILSLKGHEVICWGMDDPRNEHDQYKDYFVSNIDFNKPMNFFQSCKGASRILYSRQAKNKISRLILKVKPDIAHINNIAHQLSPSILDALDRFKIPTVMTLHDYKLFCANYLMLSGGKICDDCKNANFHRCFFNKCTKDSYTKSLLNSFEMFLHHKILKIYDKIDTFTSPSLFLIQKAREFGIDKDIIYHKYFIDSEKIKPFYGHREKAVIYFGRLSHEKGLISLIDAVKGLRVKLKIAGTGPLKAKIEEKIKREKIGNVFLLGYKEKVDLCREISSSMFSVIPSLWQENNPFSILESFVYGKPVIASNTGGIPELVRDKVTGLIFNPQTPNELQDKISYLYNNQPLISEMGQKARQFIESEFDQKDHYDDLMKIYIQTIAKKKKPRIKK